MTPLVKPTTLIVIACILGSVGITVYVFSASRLDPGLRMAALVSATNIASALMATASTMLTGQNFSSRSTDRAGDLPPGTLTKDTTEIQTPPITAPAATTSAASENVEKPETASNTTEVLSK